MPLPSDAVDAATVASNRLLSEGWKAAAGKGAKPARRSKTGPVSVLTFTADSGDMDEPKALSSSHRNMEMEIGARARWPSHRLRKKILLPKVAIFAATVSTLTNEPTQC